MKEIMTMLDKHVSWGVLAGAIMAVGVILYAFYWCKLLFGGSEE